MAVHTQQKTLQSLVQKFINAVERLHPDNPKIYVEVARLFERALENYTRRIL